MVVDVFTPSTCPCTTDFVRAVPKQVVLISEQMGTGKCSGCRHAKRIKSDQQGNNGNNNGNINSESYEKRMGLLKVPVWHAFREIVT